MGKKKKGPLSAHPAPKAAKGTKQKKAMDRATKDAHRAEVEQRRARKLEHRKKKDRKYRPTDEMWAMPAPAGLVGKLEKPKVKSKYHSYFEFAENTEKKAKKLEFQVTNDPRPPPAFKFVPIGDPTLTNACKELSRDRDAMIFIVSASSSKENNYRVYDHVVRIGYHFRESIVDEAREIIGETAVSSRVYDPRDIEPIPKSQAEITKQADAAIRDLFPRIPNTDRQMILDHAFTKGALFHGKPTVGLAPNLPLSKRVQLAVLAHIRHTHTRYDLLLREAEWLDARKVVEPICLDVLVKWRGDEETGRDQMEEILREVVVITDSEESDENSDEDSDEEEEDSSDEEGEITTASSASVSLPDSRNERRSAEPQKQHPAATQMANDEPPRDKNAQRGFKRYMAAWDQAKARQQGNARIPEAGYAGTAVEGAASRFSRSGVPSPYPNSAQAMPKPPHLSLPAALDQARTYDDSFNVARQNPYYVRRAPTPASNYHRDEVIARPLEGRPTYHQNIPYHGTAPYATREQPQPVVVRASPTNGLQDLLVPSIETASSDAVIDSPHRRQHEVYQGRQELYSQCVVERPLQSPPRRQVIVINDDTPPLKRRRVAYEDDAGRLRPLPSRDQEFYPAASRADSYLLPASSVQRRDFLIRPKRLQSQPAQGLFRDAEPSMTGPVVGERIPIYDAPPESGYLTPLPDRYRRVEGGYGSMQQEGPPFQRQLNSPQQYLENRSESSFTQRPLNGGMRVAEHDRARQPHTEFSYRETVQRPPSPAFPVSSRVSRSYEMGPESVNFSQSRLEPSLPRARDGFNAAAAESSHQNSILQESVPLRYKDRPEETFTTLRSAEARPPAQYVERPMRIKDERASVFYDKGQSAPDRYHIFERPPLRERPPTEGDSPQYIRTVRRPVIVLD